MGPGSKCLYETIGEFPLITVNNISINEGAVFFGVPE
jgi:hypothetical protein